jgi:hypothetical protein
LANGGVGAVYHAPHKRLFTVGMKIRTAEKANGNIFRMEFADDEGEKLPGTYRLTRFNENLNLFYDLNEEKFPAQVAAPIGEYNGVIIRSASSGVCQAVEK